MSTISNAERFSRAWQRAREAAEFFGGKSRDYFSESLRQEYQQENAPESIDPQNVVVPNQALPIISYGEFKQHFGTPPAGSGTFWFMASGYGRGPWDSIDLAEARNWADGTDGITVADVVDEFAPAGSEFVPAAGGFVWSNAYEAYISGGGTDAELSQFFGF